MVADGGGKRGFENGEKKGDLPSKRTKTKPNERSNSRKSARIQGPGIFVSCVRGRERKAAFELIDTLEELIGQDEDQQTGEGSHDIEDQVRSELEEFRKIPASVSSKPKTNKFKPIFTDLECFFFISIPKPFNPIELTYTLLEQVKRTGNAKSRFIHRLSPVQDTCFADLEDIKNLVRRLIKDEHLVDTTTTFKVELKMRLHETLPKMTFIQCLADEMPKSFETKLNSPTIVLNVEVFRMTVGIGIVRKFDEYRKFNLTILAQESQKDLNGPTISRIKTLDSSSSNNTQQ